MTKQLSLNGAIFRGTDFLGIPVGTSNQRGNPESEGAVAAIRVNSETKKLEYLIVPENIWREAGQQVEEKFDHVTIEMADNTIDIMPTSFYKLEDAESNVSLILDPVNWKEGQMSYVYVDFSYPVEEFDLQFSSEGTSNVYLNTARLNNTSANAMDSSYKFIRETEVMYCLKYLGNSKFHLIIEKPDGSITGGDVTVDESNKKLMPYVVNMVHTDTGFQGYDDLDLPSPLDYPSGTKIYVKDAQGKGASTSLNIMCPSGHVVDGVQGGPASFVYDWELIIFDNSGGSWSSGRTYNSVNNLTKPNNKKVYGTDPKWLTPGTWQDDSIDFQGVWAHGWLSKTNITEEKNEPVIVTNLSGVSSAPGVYKTDAVANIRQNIKFIESNIEISRFINIDVPNASRFRSIKPITGIYKGSTDNHLTKVLPSPKTTFVQNSTGSVTLKVVEESTGHAWEDGDELELINLSGNTVTLDLKNTSSVAISIFGKDGNQITQPYTLSSRGRTVIRFIDGVFYIMEEETY